MNKLINTDQVSKRDTQLAPHLFYSYCSNDDSAVADFEKIMTTLQDNVDFTDWGFRKNEGGDLYQQKIDENIQQADIIILLLSSNFLASQPCKEEMKIAVDRMKTEGIKVIPIILSACGWSAYSELIKIQALPQDGKPINDTSVWNSSDIAWEDVRKSLQNIIQDVSDNMPLQISEEFNKFLREAEYISARGEVTLEDLFVIPTVKNYNDINLSVKRVEKNYYYELINIKYNNKFLIYGDSFSGKTSLAKNLFIEHHKKGGLPLYFDGKKTKKIKIKNIIEEAIDAQYVNHKNIKSTKKERYLIIDNFHRLNNRQQKELLSAFSEQDNIVAIFCFVDTSEYMESCIKNKQKYFLSYDIYIIDRFGRLKQRECVQKWMEVKNISGYHEEDKLLDEVAQKFSSQIIPSHPYFIYTVLQAHEDFMPSGMEITQYGHCFQIFIYALLYKIGIPAKKIDAYLNFYTYFSFYSYEKNKERYSYNDLLEYIAIYKKGEGGFVIPENTDEEFLKIIIDSMVIRQIDEDGYFFDMEYTYYYFLGKYIAKNIDKELINNLCANIYRRKHAYMIIFAIHHIENVSLIEEILIRGMCHYDKYDEATLYKSEMPFDTNILQDAHQPHVDLKKQPEPEREKHAKENDAADSENYLLEKKNEEIAETNEDVQKMLNCMKTMEVLGQIAKNRQGSLNRGTIKEIMETAQSMGLRFFHYFLNLIKDEDYKSFYLESLKLQYKDMTEEKLEMHWVFFILVISHNMMDKIAYEISVENCNKIMDSICEEDPTPAKRIINYIARLNADSKMRADKQNGKQFLIASKQLIESFEDEYVPRIIVKGKLVQYVHTHDIPNVIKSEITNLVNKKD